MLIIAFFGLGLSLVALGLFFFKKYPGINSKRTRTNKHGLRYQFIWNIGRYYHLRFFDDLNNKWIYVMWSSVHMCWYGTPFDYRVYERRSFNSETDNSYSINMYSIINELKAENESLKRSVAENNKQQDEYRKLDKQRRRNEGFD